MRKVRAVAPVLGVFSSCKVFCPMRPIGPCTADPTRTGSPWKKLDIQWSGDGPKVVWRKPMNTGFSSFAVSDGKVFTQVVREIEGNPREICLALDAATGKELWFADIAVGEGIQAAAIRPAAATVRAPRPPSTAARSTCSRPIWSPAASTQKRAG